MYNTAIVFGGSGFLGRVIVQRLAQRGYRVHVICRNTQNAQFLCSMGEVGQITLTAASLFANSELIDTLMIGADVVVNAVGIIVEKGQQTFDNIHVKGSSIMAKTAARHGVKRLIHISALGADLQSPAQYGRSKALGERKVLEAYPTATIMRPSLIFGHNDHFISLFAPLIMLSPVIPLIDGGRTRFQPLYCGDVAQAVIQCLNDHNTCGKTYELGGPDIMTFKDILTAIMTIMQRPRYLLSLPLPVARLVGKIMAILPKPPLTVDQVNMLQNDAIPHDKALTCKDLGIKPISLLPELSHYLRQYQRHF